MESRGNFSSSVKEWVVKNKRFATIMIAFVGIGTIFIIQSFAAVDTVSFDKNKPVVPQLRRINGAIDRITANYIVTHPDRKRKTGEDLEHDQLVKDIQTRRLAVLKAIAAAPTEMTELTMPDAVSSRLPDESKGLIEQATDVYGTWRAGYLHGGGKRANKKSPQIRDILTPDGTSVTVYGKALPAIEPGRQAKLTGVRLENRIAVVGDKGVRVKNEPADKVSALNTGPGSKAYAYSQSHIQEAEATGDTLVNESVPGDKATLVAQTAPEVNIFGEALPDKAPNAQLTSGSRAELGVRFRSDVDGMVTGIRFYKNVKNIGVHIGSLWSNDGKNLAQATFTSETASGWQTVKFSSPVFITANTVYVASYHYDNGGFYSFSLSGMTKGIDKPPLHAVAHNAADKNGFNGLAKSTTNPAFPTANFIGSHYFVDVTFVPGGAPPAYVPSYNLCSDYPEESPLACTPTSPKDVNLDDNLINPATDANGGKKILIVPLQSGGNPPFPAWNNTTNPITPGDMQDILGNYGNPKSLVNYFKTVSYGQLNPKIDVLPNWITLDDYQIEDYRDCTVGDDSALDALIHERMKDGRINANGYNAVVYVLNGVSCQDAEAYSKIQNNNGELLTESHVFLRNYFGERESTLDKPQEWALMFAHELGHAFGLNHSRGGPADTKESEYGNEYELMGNTRNLNSNHLSVFHKWQLGWLKLGSDIATVTDNNVVNLRLEPLESTSGLRGIRIPLEKDTEKITKAIYLEYRQPGIDTVDSFSNGEGTINKTLSPGVIAEYIENIEDGKGIVKISPELMRPSLGSLTNPILQNHTTNKFVQTTFGYVGSERVTTSTETCIKSDGKTPTTNITVQLNCKDESGLGVANLFRSYGAFDKDSKYIGAVPSGQQTTILQEPTYLRGASDSCIIRDNLYVSDYYRVLRFKIGTMSSRTGYAPENFFWNGKAANVLSGSDPNKYTSMSSDYQTRVPDSHFIQMSNEKYINGVTKNDAILRTSSKLACDPVNNLVFVSDFLGTPTTPTGDTSTNGKILVYDVTSISNGQSPVKILGQSQLLYEAPAPVVTSSADTTLQNRRDHVEKRLFKIGQPRGASTFGQVQSMHYSASLKYLFVNETCRIMVYDLSGGITSGMNAKYVIGQPNFTSINPNTRASCNNNVSGYSDFTSMAFDENSKRMFVNADISTTQPHKIYMFDLTKLSNGMVPQQTITVRSSLAIDPTGTLNYDNKQDRLLINGSSEVYVIDAGPGKLDVPMPIKAYQYKTNGTSILGGRTSSKYDDATGTLWNLGSAGSRRDMHLDVFDIPSRAFLATDPAWLTPAQDSLVVR